MVTDREIRVGPRSKKLTDAEPNDSATRLASPLGCRLRARCWLEAGSRQTRALPLDGSQLALSVAGAPWVHP